MHACFVWQNVTATLFEHRPRLLDRAKGPGHGPTQHRPQLGTERTEACSTESHAAASKRGTAGEKGWSSSCMPTGQKLRPTRARRRMINKTRLNDERLQIIKHVTSIAQDACIPPVALSRRTTSPSPPHSSRQSHSGAIELPTLLLPSHRPLMPAVSLALARRFIAPMRARTAALRTAWRRHSRCLHRAPWLTLPLPRPPRHPSLRPPPPPPRCWWGPPLRARFPSAQCRPRWWRGRTG